MADSENQYQVSFQISREQYEQAQLVIGRIRNRKDKEETVAMLVDLIGDLTEEGLEFYYMRPLRLARANFFTKSATHMGLSSSRRAILMATRRVMGNMSFDQLNTIADHIETIVSKK
jgi:hypothetical protein